MQSSLSDPAYAKDNVEDYSFRIYEHANSIRIERCAIIVKELKWPIKYQDQYC